LSTTKELKRGDNDKKKTWGGSKQEAEPEYTVEDLQANLNSVEVYSNKIDGDFGPKTERALKIYQWVVHNSKNAIKNSAIVTLTPKLNVSVTGKLDSTTYKTLQNWVNNKYLVTGDLVRISSSDMSNIELGPSFKVIGKPVTSNGEFVVSKAVVKMIKLMNKTAKSLKITIKVNQVLRVHGVKVTGSVVPPATKSQHLIGHAIDCNIVDGGNWNTSKNFSKKQQTDNAKKFIKKMKENSYRWGGYFSKTDTPHFDKQLVSSLFDYDVKFFLNQKQISSGEPIEKEIIPK